MAYWMPQCGIVHEVTEVPTDVELVVPDEVSRFVAEHGGRLFVWISVHRGFPFTICLLDASLEAPKGDVSFRRLKAPGFDLYFEGTQHVWPKKIEFALKRHRRVEAYWNGLGWIW